MHLGETCYVEFSWRCPGEVACEGKSMLQYLCICEIVYLLMCVFAYFSNVYLSIFEEHVMLNLAAGVRVK